MNQKGLIGFGKKNLNNKINPKTKSLIIFSIIIFVVVALMVNLIFGGGDDKPETAAMFTNADSDEILDTEYFDEDSPFGTSSNEVSTTQDTNTRNVSKDDVAAKPSQNEARIHTVVAGDSLTKIARQYYGDGNKFWIIQRANPNINPNRLQIGQKINVPPLQNSQTPAGSANSTTQSPKETQPAKNNETQAWLPETKKDDENPDSAKNERTSKPFFPWEFQEQPDFPDDSNSGRVEEYVVVEETTHIASAGDTPISLALRYYSEIALARRIQEANPGISWTQLSGGERIIIPKLTRVRYIAPKKQGPIIPDKSSSGRLPQPQNSDTDDFYIVKAGDTLSSIARRFLGSDSRFNEIMKLNNLTSDKLSIGQKLRIPKK